MPLRSSPFAQILTAKEPVSPLFRENAALLCDKPRLQMVGIVPSAFVNPITDRLATLSGELLLLFEIEIEFVIVRVDFAWTAQKDFAPAARNERLGHADDCFG